jgi:hypothetical protein
LQNHIDPEKFSLELAVHRLELNSLLDSLGLSQDDTAKETVCVLLSYSPGGTRLSHPAMLAEWKTEHSYKIVDEAWNGYILE